MAFFSQYSHELTVVLFFLGFLPGILIGYCCWRFYCDRAFSAEREVKTLTSQLAEMRGENQKLQTQLVSAT